MPSRISRSASAFPENQGKRRENGTERTSATVVTPALRSSVTKRSAGRLEWPMVRRSQASGGVMRLLVHSGAVCLLHRKEFPAFQRMS